MKIITAGRWVEYGQNCTAVFCFDLSLSKGGGVRGEGEGEECGGIANPPITGRQENARSDVLALQTPRGKHVMKAEHTTASGGARPQFSGSSAQQALVCAEWSCETDYKAHRARAPFHLIA